jgi:hypothetical protein
MQTDDKNVWTDEWSMHKDNKNVLEIDSKNVWTDGRNMQKDEKMCEQMNEACKQIARIC